ncbi:MAG: hypothetical protein QXH45_06605 [Thermosphaera sp.]
MSRDSLCFFFIGNEWVIFQNFMDLEDPKSINVRVLIARDVENNIVVSPTFVLIRGIEFGKGVDHYADVFRQVFDNLRTYKGITGESVLCREARVITDAVDGDGIALAYYLALAVQNILGAKTTLYQVDYENKEIRSIDITNIFLSEASDYLMTISLNAFTRSNDKGVFLTTVGSTLYRLMTDDIELPINLKVGNLNVQVNYLREPDRVKLRIEFDAKDKLDDEEARRLDELIKRDAVLVSRYIKKYGKEELDSAFVEKLINKIRAWYDSLKEIEEIFS